MPNVIICKVERMKNGEGHSNLLAILEEAIPDMSIGSALVVPYVNGYKDPIKVELMLDDNGKPIKIMGQIAMVTRYIYE